MRLFGTSSRATLSSAILTVRASKISDVFIADNRRVPWEVELSSTSQASRRSMLGTDYVSSINVHICRSVVPEVGRLHMRTRLMCLKDDVITACTHYHQHVFPWCKDDHRLSCCRKSAIQKILPNFKIFIGVIFSWLRDEKRKKIVFFFPFFSSYAAGRMELNA